MKLGNKTYTERKEAGDLFLAVINSGKYDDRIIGKLNGFEIIATSKIGVSGKIAIVRGHGSYNVEISTSETGSIIRLENFFKSLERELGESQERLTSLHNELSTAKTEVIKEFEYSETLSTLSEQLATLDAELDLNKQEITETVIDDEQFKDELVA